MKFYFITAAKVEVFLFSHIRMKMNTKKHLFKTYFSYFLMIASLHQNKYVAHHLLSSFVGYLFRKHFYLIQT